MTYATALSREGMGDAVFGITIKKPRLYRG